MDMSRYYKYQKQTKKNKKKKQGEMQAADYSPVQQRHLGSGDLLFIRLAITGMATLLNTGMWPSFSYEVVEHIDFPLDE